MGERLANGTKGLVHGRSPDRSTAFGHASISGTNGKEFEESDWVIDFLKEWVNMDLGAKLGPLFPIAVTCTGILSTDAGSLRVVCSAEISEEVMLALKGQSCQDRSCGYSRLKWASRSTSDKCQRREQSSAMTLDLPGICEKRGW